MIRAVSLLMSASLPAPSGPTACRLSLLDRFGLHCQRRRLAALDAHLLDDIGLTTAEVRAEAGRPVWDAPRYWRSGY